MPHISSRRALISTILALTITLGLAATVRAADSVPPVVSAVSPLTATVGQATTLSITASDNDSGITNCYLIIGLTSLTSDMTRVSGDDMSSAYSQSYTFPFEGSYTVAARCVDHSGNIGTGSNVTVVVSAEDTRPPYVGTVSPTTAMAGEATTFSAIYSDDVRVTGCFFNPGNGTRLPATMTGSATLGTVSYTHTFSSPGNYTTILTCADAARGEGSAFGYITVSGSGPDLVPPRIGSIGYSTPLVVGSPVVFGTTYSDNIGVASCFLNVNGSSVGFATLTGSPAEGNAGRTHTFSTAGSYIVNITCRDAALNSAESDRVTVVIAAAAPAGDVLAPTFTGAISPLTATVNTPVTLSLGYADNVGVTECYLYVDGSLAGGSSSGGMTGTTSRSHTFTTSGAHTARFQCRDAAGNQGVSTTYTVNVAAVSTPGGGGSGGSGGTPTPIIPIIPTPGSVLMGNLIKAICPRTGIVNADHPCRAVYYYGQDGRRHAFPNERVFFTWFSDFNGVREVSDATMASIGLGRNVTYRPGTKMIKFRTVNRVYAVARGGALRWVTTEDVARQLYGATWASQIDDVGDTFYSNYTSGADITASTQFNRTSETASATTIDQNW